MNYEFFMWKAIEQAQAALEIDEVPVGCVVALEEKIIGAGYNRRNSGKNALYHAELLAINEACAFVGDWRLEDAVLFVTVEPCPMCAGAILQSRMKTVVFGTRNKKAGCCGSILNLLELPDFNHQVCIVEGVLKDECADIMRAYFSGLRKRVKERKKQRSPGI